VSSQHHGIEFEKIIFRSGNYNIPPNLAVGHTAMFDIPASCDRRGSLPTSVKSTHNDVVGLGDARRIWSIDKSFRMVVVRYRQASTLKLAYEIDEFVISDTVLDVLRGSVTLDVVNNFHEQIKSYGPGDHLAARQSAKNTKSMLAGRSAIDLNPKIDSKVQRRLQSSIRLSRLHQIKGVECQIYTTKYGDVSLPFAIPSKPRQF
jgi:hypothetical protein